MSLWLIIGLAALVFTPPLLMALELVPRFMLPRTPRHGVKLKDCPYSDFAVDSEIERVVDTMDMIDPDLGDALHETLRGLTIVFINGHVDSPCREWRDYEIHPKDVRHSGLAHALAHLAVRAKGEDHIGGVHHHAIFRSL